MRTEYPATWFRMYAEFATDPKVQMLSEADQRRYIMLLCLRCSNGDVTLHETEVAFQLRVSDEEWGATKARLIAKKLIDDDNKPTAWERRQRASDSSTERVARHRAAHKKESNGDVTLQKRTVETETETETEVKAIGAQIGNRAESIPPATPPDKRENGTKLPKDWLLPKKWGDWALTEFPVWNAERVRLTAERFKDHWLANSNRREGKKADWEATWRNWCRSDAERSRPPSGKPSPHILPTPGTGAYGKTTPMTAEQEAELERQNAIDPIF